MIPPTFGDRLDEADPIDTRFAGTRPAPGAGRWSWRLRSRPALGLLPTLRPGLILLPVGMALGPYGLNLLSAPTLSYLDPAISVALAALGVMVGLGLDLRRQHETLLLAAASVQSTVTVILVTGGLAAGSWLWQNPGQASWAAAFLLGICAAASSMAAGESSTQAVPFASRVGDLDDVVPIVLGGVALGWLRESSMEAGVLTLGLCLVAIVVAVAGWLLIAEVPESEQHVIVAGSLLLLGGIAEYLSLSALLTGLVAGLFWNASGGPGHDRIDRDMRYLQHPLLVLLLLVAGARFDFSTAVLILGVVYVFTRTVGKLVGARLAAPMLRSDQATRLGRYLISPGIVGIAFALNVVQAKSGPPGMPDILSVVILGFLAAEALSLLIQPTREAR